MNFSPWMALVCVCLPAVSAALAQSRPAAPEPAPAAPVVESASAATGASDPWASPEIAAPRLDNDVIRRPHARSAATPTQETKPAPNNGFFRTSASLAGVIGLIVLLAWGYRAVTSANGRLGRRLRGGEPGLIQVIGRTTLGPRQVLCLVRVGPQLVLVGATHDSLRTLTVVQDPDLAARLAGQHSRPAVRRPDFLHCLETESDAYAEPATASARDQTDHLGSVKQRLSQTLRRMEKVAAAGA